MTTATTPQARKSDTRAFLNEIELLETQFDVLRLLKRICKLFNLSNFMVMRMPDASDQRISDCAILANWPPDMIARYDELGLLRTSPFLSTAQKSTRPIVLSLAARTAASPCEAQTESDMLFREFGFLLGVAIPVHDYKGGRALINFEGSRESLCHTELIELTMLSIHIYDRLASIAAADGNTEAPLTDRELDCLRWTADGKTSSDIARIMGLSEHTVNHYLTRATRKLGSVNRTNAVAKAIRRGWIG